MRVVTSGHDTEHSPDLGSFLMSYVMVGHETESEVGVPFLLLVVLFYFKDSSPQLSCLAFSQN